jgi:hypothetical protein
LKIRAGCDIPQTPLFHWETGGVPKGNSSPAAASVQGETMSPRKPSENEEEYFARQEFERLKALALEEEAAKEESKCAKLKDLHHMCCPKCGHTMVEVELEGIKVDKCICCKGIYFDNGELEQILEKQPGRRFLKTIFQW